VSTTAFVAGRVSVTVPATSANLGPGFDCLGLALELRDTLVGEVVDAGLVIEVDGEGADEVARDETHLVVRAMRAAFDEAAVQPPGLRLACTNRIPHSRGLGSSSAAIVGGLVLARALLADAEALDGDTLLRLANDLEGHPDNVAPALLGGLVVSGQAEGEVWASRAALDPGIGAVVFVPPEGVRTEIARGLLPDTVPHAAASANTGRAALLVAALAGSPGDLWRGTEDFVHQAYREPAMPASLALVRRLREARVPAVVSGAGPTVLALTGPGLLSSTALTSWVPADWVVHVLAISPTGATRG
jgi:homoserine kinase